MVCSITSAGIAVSIALNTSADSMTGEIKENSLRCTSRFDCLFGEQLSLYPILVLTEKYCIGMWHLTPDQLAWSVEASADAGLSNEHLESLIEAAKRVLNKRHPR